MAISLYLDSSEAVLERTGWFSGQWCWMLLWAWSAHSEQQRKKGAEHSLVHERRKGTTLTLIIHCHWFPWLAPFSGWRCIIRGISCCCVCVCQEWNAANVGFFFGRHRKCSWTYTYFRPLVIRIRLWYHLHLGTQKERECKQRDSSSV